MATFTPRGPGQIRVQVRRTGYPTQSRTFENMRDARAWAATVESEMHRGIFVDRSEAETTTLFQILERYLSEVTPKKRGRIPEASRLKHLMRQPLALRRLAQLKSADFYKYRELRLMEVSGKSVREELNLLSVVLNTAKVEWSIPVENWVKLISKPPVSEERDRRLMDDEEERVLESARASKAQGLECAIVLAIETGMRRGELAGLEWSQVDLQQHVVQLKLTKNGDDRTVPLTVRAEAALRALPRNISGKVFTFYDSDGMGAAFRRACARAGIEDLRFHDLRHEAASRMAPHMQRCAVGVARAPTSAQPPER